jgi:hypothetical protein
MLEIEGLLLPQKVGPSPLESTISTLVEGLGT